MMSSLLCKTCFYCFYIFSHFRRNVGLPSFSSSGKDYRSETVHRMKQTRDPVFEGTPPYLLVSSFVGCMSTWP